MKKILVIGASGLLGSHLVKALQGKAEVIEASR
jgi:NAD(P)-dependent dehydrogenase (short-subunit alcohol dehydrogenase family)